ncbi:hypothetical protein AU194_20550 [Mycobacterium sp. GA-2829]|nr:hypothetical protein AU194_20550 [Mycobacterium sp. GA-2829]
MSHHIVELDDGHRVGVMVGGSGVPLVFLHGIALNTRVYMRFLSRLSAHGFRVIAIDAAAHGRTAPLPGKSFSASVDLVARAMDALGVRRAVVVGHSMGGRATIELAAACPDRVAAAVLLDAAAGDAFDASAKKAFQSFITLPVGVVGGLYDTTVDWWRCSDWRERRLYGISMAAALGRWGRRPQSLAGVMRAIAGSAPTQELLRQARTSNVPFIVVHAENDLVVPRHNAEATARHSNAKLHVVPRACHSWMIADPQRGADTLGTLLSQELPKNLRRDAVSFLAPDALVTSLDAPARVS